MSIKLVLVLLVLLLAACSPTSIPTDSPTSKPTDSPTSMPTDSGIEGHVTIGPMCPVVQINNPCPDKPYQATLTILTTTSHQKVIQFVTDANGYFHVALAPGEYILHPESPSVMPHATEIPFTVTDYQFTLLDVVYDSGIR